MAETVFILGAGASVEAGAPLMDGFLTWTKEVVERSEDPDLAADLALVNRARRGLEAAIVRVRSRLENLEELLGLFEMGDILGTMPPLTDEERRGLVAALTRLIAATIEWKLPLKVHARKVLPHPSYGSFAQLVASLSESVHGPSSVAIITLNYDCAAELALWLQGIPYTYCLPFEQPHDAVKILKLHGSLNWHDCATPADSGHEVQALFVEDYVRNAPDSFLADGEHILQISKSAAEIPGALSGGPVIVPPSWTKTAVKTDLMPIWREAARELSGATRVYVLGYSLPPTDRFFRDLLSLGMREGAILERFWVYNPDSRERREQLREDPSQSAEARFGAIPSEMLREGPYHFEPRPFSDAVTRLFKEVHPA